MKQGRERLILLRLDLEEEDQGSVLMFFFPMRSKKI